MARLIHLNGLPGVGKSTLARRYATDHPGVLCCDIDVLRTLVGGWQQDFAATGELIRPPALALIRAYLESGHDVVLPQLLTRESELERFRQAATSVGAAYVHAFLDAPPIQCADRLYGRPHTNVLDEVIEAVIDAAGGQEAIHELHGTLSGLAATVAETRRVDASGDLADTYGALLEVL